MCSQSLWLSLKMVLIILHSHHCKDKPTRSNLTYVLVKDVKTSFTPADIQLFKVNNENSRSIYEATRFLYLFC